MTECDKSSHNYASNVHLTCAIPTALPMGLLAEAGIIAVIAFIIYFPSLTGGFIWDDNDIYITDNQIIKSSDGLYRFWFTTEPLDYYPVSNTALWVEWRLWGMNPTGYHLVSLILHVLHALLIWVILRKMSVLGAFLAALIFAVHPVNVEAVAWIAQRKDMMAMLFFLLSILCYMKMDILSSTSQIDLNRLSSPLLYCLSLAAFVLGMLCKGSVPMLPLVLLGIVWWRRRLTFWDLVRTAPFFVAAVILSAVHVWFQTHGSGLVIREASFAQRLLGSGCVVWFYLYKALLPVNLSFVYPQWNIETENLLWWLPLLAAGAVTAVLWWYRYTWSRAFFLAWVFFCVSLVPVMGFSDPFFMRFSLVADHYQHIAIIGVIALVSAGLATWFQKIKDAPQWVATAVALVALMALSFLSWRQSGLYVDEITLYQATLEKNPECWMAHNNLSNALSQSGRHKEAIAHCRQALKLKPDYAEAYNNLGAALLQTGRPEEAIYNCRQALRLKPDFPEASNNLGSALFLMGQPREAIEYFQQALQIQPDYILVRHNLANAFESMGQYQQAIEQYEKVLFTEPNFASTHLHLGAALFKTGRLDEAIGHYKQALRLKPDYLEAQANLGAALVLAGRPQEAIEHCEQVLQLKPDYPEVHYNLANALFQLGRPKEAIEHYKHALQIKSDYPEAYNNLGLALVQTGRPQEAIDPLKQALRLKPDYVSACNNLALAYAGVNQPAGAIAAAQKGLELARSQGNEALAKQIGDWLDGYNASLSK